MIQNDPTLQPRLDAISGMMRSAGRSEEHINSIQELAKLAAQRKAQEAMFNPETDPVIQRQLYLQKLEQDQPSWSPESDPTLQRQLYMQALEGGAPAFNQETDVDFQRWLAKEETSKAMTGGEDPLKYVMKEFGSKYLTGRSIEERRAQAEAIQELGLKGYLENSPLTDLLTPKEIEKRDAATGILNDLSQIESIIAKGSGAKNVQGVGPLGRFRPEFLTNAEGVTTKQLITRFTAQRMNEISGAAVSEKEVARLTGDLPTVGDTEKTVLTKARNIATSIEIGLEMQELAKREDITLDQAYAKYGEQAFKSAGQKVPAWIQRSKLPENPPNLGSVRVVAPNGKTGTIPESQLEAALQKGYKRYE